MVPDSSAREGPTPDIDAPEFRPERWFYEIDDQLAPREGGTRGYLTGGQGLELGSGKQHPALFSCTIARS